MIYRSGCLKLYIFWSRWYRLVWRWTPEAFACLSIELALLETGTPRGIFQLKANEVGGRPGLGIVTKNWEALCGLERMKCKTISITRTMTYKIPNFDHGCQTLRCIALSWVEALGNEFLYILLNNNKWLISQGNTTITNLHLLELLPWPTQFVL